LATAGGDVLVRRAGNVLARLPLEGGTPRDLLTGVDEATWDRSGTRLAVTRLVNGRWRLEYPVGKVLLETTQVGYVDCLHLSPDGERIAFAYHPNSPDFAADICVVEKSGEKRTLSGGWPDMDDLAWSADGKEVWFSATREGVPKEIHAVTLSGRERLVVRFPEKIVLGDIAPDGRVLVSLGPRLGFETRGRMAGDAAERDLSWLDGTLTPVLSPDGTQMVFQEWGEGGGVAASAYHWRMDGSAPKRLGDGTPYDVSPDWKTVLVGVGQGENLQLRLVPIGAGEATTLPRGSIRTYQWCYWHPDGKRIVIFGSDAEGKTGIFVQDLAGGLPRFLARLARWSMTFSHDGRFPVGLQEGGPWFLYPIDGGEPRPLPFVTPEESPVVFGDDGKSLFVRTPPREFPIRVVKVDLETGRRNPWLELSPADPVGVAGSPLVTLTPNGRFYAYFYFRNLTNLYLVEGLK
jgi:Tol biopolymer transport system component